ncbi:MAG TPA: L,D-transpeptidase family protein [Rhizomicrobium sp.]|nr:L,D-transpeptidase family protein [Rhizomicrobium sp.]
MITRRILSGLARCLMVAAAASLGPQAAIAATPSASRVWYSAGDYPQLSLPDGRRETIHSMLDVAKPMKFGDFVWDENHVPKGQVWVRIDLPRQILSIFRAGNEIGTAVILYGTDGKPSPTGRFAILEKKADYYSHSYHAPMPYMLRLTNDGVAIHGSTVRQGHATHGCIGVPLDFARLLFAAARKGDTVVIIPAETGPH